MLAEEKGEKSEDLWGTSRSGMKKEKYGLACPPLKITMNRLLWTRLRFFQRVRLYKRESL
ncbi:hypothetical protein AN963_11925 [Brevibacillus choshinensis]|uniref:Uncharacterized protein n=1 Tax=Brevibacillus choshinensis TaxID=54911 RepID=A0ABR5N582_BRECH|nr:hypothetical protein AN963_11925 [Brevibacillus choshinensis]